MLSSEAVSSSLESELSNVAAEQKLLSVLLNDNSIFDDVDLHLRAEHFSEAAHSEIYRIVSQLCRDGRGASPVVVSAYCRSEGLVDIIGGESYISELAAIFPDTFDFMHYVRHIIDVSTRRNLVKIGNEIVSSSSKMDVNRDSTAIIEDAESMLYDLSSPERFGRGFLTFADALEQATHRASRAYKNRGEGGLAGISTGFRNIDYYLGGLQNSDLIILAGRPSMGKTALATNIAYHVASRYKSQKATDGSENLISGGVVGFFSLEMSAEQLATRIISEQTSISSEKIRRGSITEKEYSMLAEKADELKKIPIYIDETGGLSIAQLSARARRLKRQKKLNLLIIDYLQLLRGDDRRKDSNRVQEITHITVSLKSLAKELNIPVIALSQLSRQVEQREMKRPQLSDLRESGSIEQDADIVMFVFREEYYLRREEPKEGTQAHQEWQEVMDEVYNLAELIIAKQRHGAIGTAKLVFSAEYTRFTDMIGRAQVDNL